MNWIPTEVSTSLTFELLKELKPIVSRATAIATYKNGPLKSFFDFISEAKPHTFP